MDRTFKKNLSIYDSEGLLAKRCFRDPGAGWPTSAPCAR
jgi:hypothetical protein